VHIDVRLAILETAGGDLSAVGSNRHPSLASHRLSALLA
jgi:hypothetical protein